MIYLNINPFIHSSLIFVFGNLAIQETAEWFLNNQNHVRK